MNPLLLVGLLFATKGKGVIGQARAGDVGGQVSAGTGALMTLGLIWAASEYLNRRVR